MIGDNLQLKPHYFDVSQQLLHFIGSKGLSKKRLVIGISGESGSGKSVTAKCLQVDLMRSGNPAVILHQDDYFKLPPHTNHEKRKNDPNWLGMGEVHLDLLQRHIQAFLSGQEGIMAPLVDFRDNRIVSQKIEFKNIQVLVVEGTYVLSLNDLDWTVFMDRTYLQTQKKRKERERDQNDPIIELFLAKEHALIRPLKNKARLIIDENYNVQNQE